MSASLIYRTRKYWTNTFILNFADLNFIILFKDFNLPIIMEDIRQSVSRMFNRMRKPSMKSSKVANSPIKAGKVFSSPNLLHLPSGQLQQKSIDAKTVTILITNCGKTTPGSRGSQFWWIQWENWISNAEGRYGHQQCSL